jgi:hypothetical protein
MQDDAYNYATHPLPCTLSDSAWIGDVDFIYTGRGTGGVGHELLSATSGTLNTWNTGGTITTSNQNAIATWINCPINGAQSTDSIYAGAKFGTTWGTISNGIALSINITYYLRLERITPTTGQISLFTDAARTINAPGSPQLFSINSSVTGLNVVQQGCIPQGYLTRTLTGTLQNLNICNPSTTGIQQVTGNNAQVNIYPNPNNGSFIIEPSSATKQSMQVYDVNGKLVLSQTINGKTTIDASSLNEGIYNISLLSNEGVINKRLVIVR